MSRSDRQTTGFGLFVHQSHGVQWMPVAAALLAGVLQAVSLAYPLGAAPVLDAIGVVPGHSIWWLQLLALAALVWLLDGPQRMRSVALRAWVFATAWLACTFAWLFTSMHTYGGLAAPLASVAVLALAGVLAIYYVAACLLYRLVAPVNQAIAALVFASFWLLAELGKGVLLTGFGWGAVGYAQLDGPLAAWIPWVGLYGLCALAAVLAAGLVGALRAPAWRERALLGVVIVGAISLPQFLPSPQGASSASLSVTLLQGNIAQDEKFEMGSGVPKALHWYGQQLQASRSALIVTPETALALLPQQLPEGYWQAIEARFDSGEQAALVGMPLGSHALGYTNSVVGLRPGQALWRYDKHHLVPFGEFIPPLFRWFTNLLNIPLGDFNRGALPQPTFDWQGQRLAISICYENLFTEELTAYFADAASAPTVMVNISNLGWFGKHLAMDQHLQITRMRALELARPFLLATNTGRTAIVDHLARVTHAAPSHEVAVLQGQVQGRTGITPYAAWLVRFGLWPLVLVALAPILLALFSRRYT